MNTPERFRTTDVVSKTDQLRLIVHVDEFGVVHTVDVVTEGKKATLETMSNEERVLAYVHVKAWQATRLSPAKLNGVAVPSAFSYCVTQTVSMN